MCVNYCLTRLSFIDEPSNSLFRWVDDIWFVGEADVVVKNQVGRPTVDRQGQR